MKQIYLKTFLLALFTIFGMRASAYDAYVDGIYYNLNQTDKTASVTYGDSGNSYSGEIIIPESVVYEGITYSVTSIGDETFYRRSGLTSIKIPNSVTSIGRFAFGDCSGLTSVEIPNSVTSIGDYAFRDCSALTSVVIPNSVTSIGDWAFYGCSSLTSIEIPNSVTSIGRFAFAGCSGLTSVEIPNSVTSIGGHAFQDCSALTSVVIPNSVTSIGGAAFSGCSSIMSIIVKDDNPKYDSRNNCNAIIQTDNNELLTGCQSTIIPNSVTSIGDWAFYGCSSLTSIEIPNSVTSIGRFAFAGCSGLTSVEIPNSVTSIGDYAFRDCSALTSVVIPNSVTTIGERAFSGCSGLTSVEIPNSVTTIGERAFSGCSGLTSVEIPNSVRSISDYAFYYCSSLTSVEIPNSVTSFGYGAFYGCSSLTSVEIPSSVMTIGDWAFYGCSSLTSVVIPNSVTTIGERAFSNCSGLTSVKIPNSVKYIDGYAFSDCTGLTSIEIPNSVKSIGESAFSGCSGLTSVKIPNSVTRISYNAFSGCSNLNTIISHIQEPFNIDYYCFGSSTYNYAILYVPAQSIELYRKAGGWKNFKNILPIEFGKSFSMSVIDDQSHDVTNEVSIVWYDGDGKELGSGNSLNGVDDGVDIYYSVLLEEGLGRVYREVKMKKVDNNINTITCELEKIGRVMLEGRVTAADIDKTSATVNVKQMLNGKYEQTYQTQTNEQGIFQVEVYDDETDITISSDRYLNATIHRDNFSGNSDVGTIPLNLVTGFSVVANINLQKAVETGDTEEVTAWDDGLSNIEFSLTNTTKNKEITDFTVQNGNVIIKSGADMGDGIRLVAKSKQGVFADAETTFNIKEETNAFDLLLTERGGLEAVCNLSNNGGTNGYLYDNNGVLASMGSYMGEILSLRHLPKGTYTLVSIGRSMLLGSMTNLSDLASVGLTEDEDYVATRVEVSDGVISKVQVNDVPRFQETKFYYTTTNTYFNVEKPSITAGNYLTLSAHLDFKPEYADKVNGVSLSIDLPDGCQLVENSAIANRQSVTHTKNGNRVTFTLTPEQYQSTLRFCIIPVLNKNYTITAIASFDGDRKVQQPIGTAQFEAKGLSLSVPPLTASSNVIISGTAKGYSEVAIYDNDVLIGKTTSKADGTWSAQAELFKPRSHSFHDIYAKIITENGMALTSETKQVEYDKNGLVPEKVTMTYYNGWLKKNIYVEFNLLDGTTTPSSYQFNQIGDFTFLADFTRNDTTQIKNVNIKVLNTDGTVRTLPAIYDTKQNHWVATTKYTSANRLPQNVTVEYDLSSNSPIYDEYTEKEMNTLINNMLIEVDNAYNGCELEIISEDDKSISFVATTNGYETKENFKITVLDYEQIIKEYANKLVCQIKNDTADICFVIYDNDDIKSGIVVWDNFNRAAFDISTENVTHTNMLRQRLIVPFIISSASGVILNIYEYNKKKEIITLWRNIYKSEITTRNKLYKNMVNYLNAKCPDGSYKIKDDYYRNRLENEVDQYSSLKQEYLSDFKKVLDIQQKKLKQLCTLKGIANVAFSSGGLIFKGTGKVFEKVNGAILRRLGKAMTNLGTGALIEFSSQATSQALGYKLENQSKDPEKIISDWYETKSIELTNENARIVKSIRGAYSKCDKEPETPNINEDEPTDDKSDFRGQGSTPILDPSGYVYEAVTSNRLQGVTATVYQKAQKEDMYGDITEEAVAWNAEDYSQKNPLITDQDGFYRWDVPQGMWQVKYEKEGYETMYSDWLPVPPPQLDVNIGMYQGIAPQVEKMRGFESGIVIDMSKYMKPETYGKNSITVTRNGQKVNGTIIMLNAEVNEYEGREYASKIKFIPEMGFNVTDNVVVTVHKEVESYCGIKMENDHTETVKIEPEIKEIVSDSVITVTYQGAKVMDVLVLPKDASVGKILHVDSSSPIIASLSENEVEIDSDGRATFTLNGELPGGANLSYTVDGSDVSASTKVYVTLENDMVAMPQASIRSGETVNSGTLLVLTCETEDATIYYTLDGSCPCDETKRIKYEGPITINGDVTVKAIAVKEDMDDSDIATFMYILNGIQGPGYDKTNVGIEYQNGAFVITGAEGATCNIFDLAGQLVASKQRIARRERMVFSKKGVYVVNVETTDSVTVAKKLVVK